MEDLDLTPGLGRSPGEGNGPLQYSGLENSMDRGAWQATVLGIAKSWSCLRACHLLAYPHQPCGLYCIMLHSAVIFRNAHITLYIAKMTITEGKAGASGAWDGAGEG